MKSEKTEVEIDTLNEIFQYSERRSLSFESDIQEQFDSNASILPERNLLKAILMRALEDVIGRDPEIRQGAIEWFFSDNKNDVYETEGNYKTFTFTGICNLLEIEKSLVLREVSKLIGKDRF